MLPQDAFVGFVVLMELSDRQEFWASYSNFSELQNTYGAYLMEGYKEDGARFFSAQWQDTRQWAQAETQQILSECEERKNKKQTQHFYCEGG